MVVHLRDLEGIPSINQPAKAVKHQLRRGIHEASLQTLRPPRPTRCVDAIVFYESKDGLDESGPGDPHIFGVGRRTEDGLHSNKAGFHERLYLDLPTGRHLRLLSLQSTNASRGDLLVSVLVEIDSSVGLHTSPWS